MRVLTIDEIERAPHQLIEGAGRGEPALVTRDGEPFLMSIPLGKGLESREVRTEVAVHLYDREQISLGLAARIAGLDYHDMLDELNRRGVPVIRIDSDELTRELTAFGR